MFRNQVSQQQISTPSIKQAPVDTFVSDVATGLMNTFQKAPPSESQLREQRQTQGIQAASKLHQQYLDKVAIEGTEDARIWYDNQQRKVARSLPATAHQAFAGETQRLWGSPMEADREALRREQEAEEFSRMNSDIQLGAELLIANGTPPEQVNEDDALSLGVYERAKTSAMEVRARELDLLMKESTHKDAERVAVSNVLFEGYSRDVVVQTEALLMALEPQLKNPATKSQAIAQGLTRIGQMRSSLYSDAAAFMRENGGQIGDIDNTTINRIEDTLEFIEAVLAGEHGNTAIDAMITGDGLALMEASYIHSDGSFSRQAALDYALQRRLGTNATLRAAKAGSRPIPITNPVELLRQAQNMRDANIPSDPSQNTVYYPLAVSGIQVVAESPGGTQARQEAAEMFLKTLMRGSSGTRTEMSVSHRGDGIPSMHRQLSNLQGSHKTELQRTVVEVADNEGIDLVELASQDAGAFFTTKVAPLMRTWDDTAGGIMGRASFESQGGKIKFTAPAATPPRMPMRSQQFRDPRQETINKNVREIERRLNEMVNSHHNMTGMDKSDIADGIVGQLELLRSQLVQ